MPAGEAPTASVKATRCEVFGSCVGVIDVSIEVENSEMCGFAVG